jgi:hypothetical protein
MFRYTAITVLAAVIWFTLNDTPSVPKSASSTAMIVAPAPPAAAPETIVMAQAPSAQSTRAAPAAQTARRGQSGARAKIRVTPRYPYRRFHTVNPLPYDVEYPGPRGVRHCVNRYVAEARPSGTVLVPRMRCWWKQG